MLLVAGCLVIAATVYAVLRGLEVRLALLLAAVCLGALAGDIGAILRTFLGTFSQEQFVVPICTAMGFAHVLRLTQCDQHLVHLLVQPLQRLRTILVPGAVLVGFAVNIPVISQTSTAVCVGPVMVPLMLAARVSPVTTGAALLLGASMGGELLNPGAPELRTVSSRLDVAATDCISRILPLLLIQVVVATTVFWWRTSSFESRTSKLDAPATKDVNTEPFRVNLFKAAVPVIPLVLLLLTGGPRYLVPVPHHWLVKPGTAAETSLFDGRLIGAAMLVGTAIASLTSPREFSRTAKAFFEGAGYAFTHIISLIVTANCFGTGVEKIGLAQSIGYLVKKAPSILVPLAGALPLGFAWVSGSGMAATQSLYGFFADPAITSGVDPIRVGAVVSIAAAAGRTMSPVAAVTLMCATLTNTNPFALVRRVALPLLLGLTVMVVAAMLAR
jgi:DcuC family C4-dicarboxylate transporter